ncbi:Mediator of RNA polymerase II transcription subunit 31 [Colletotrichum spinosum]|uniref:Mediator of RNA polymerase II transcription subunit 31 n=1 Tax=Colletotrichum spinosum TaxID=1347390 RepID=A0A4R8PWP6_9PEZI|nr:Mediator of RNA polymerase II transcription subunit 31 [Colletotrichum spinosum]
MAQPQERPSQPPAPPSDDEPVYGGFTRFEIELEASLCSRLCWRINAEKLCTRQFVQSLANPLYLNHLATQKLFSRPEFVAYLNYLQYWSRPPYLKYLMYPGPTLKHLELLQQEQFRQDIISPDLVQRLIDDGMRAAVEWHRSDA